ncbi:InlB B-repeat-containing protein [Christensenellaceae bacterium OttesenSCG-928-K19]|nr:InlB B-repeat-containing protein [Christensenellaceae bacterium OttesenSCG-928-K19]
MFGGRRRGRGFAVMVIAIILLLSTLFSTVARATELSIHADKVIARFTELDNVTVPAGLTASEVISEYMPSTVGIFIIAENKNDREQASVSPAASDPDSSGVVPESDVEKSSAQGVVEPSDAEGHGAGVGFGNGAGIPAEVSVGWTAEGYDKDTPGDYIFTATLGEGGYILAEGVTMPAVTVTVQEPASIMPMALGTSFSVLRVYKDAGYASSPGTATLVSDLLDTSSPLYNATLEPDVIYFLYAGFNKPAGVDAMQVRFGDKADQTTNGLAMVTPLDGTFTVGSIGNSFFDRLVSYTDYPDPKYGYSSESNAILDNKRATYALKDGTMVYGMKSNILDGAGIAFDYGFKIDDALYAGNAISDAFSFRLGKLDGSSQFQTVPGYDEESVDITVAPKNTLRSWFGSADLTGTVGANTATTTLYYLGNAIPPAKQTAALFDKVEIRVQVPENINLANYGLATNWQKHHTSYGYVSASVGAPSGGNKIITFTITGGFKNVGGGLPLYLEFGIPSSFTGAQFAAKILGGTVTIMDQQLPITIAGIDAVTYHMLSAEGDETQFTSPNDLNRQMYNTTLDLGEGIPYSAYMGSVLVRNKNTSYSTPYEKTYEASYNITGAAANMNIITIPCDIAALPTKITVSAKNASGEIVTIDLTPAQIAALGIIRNTTNANVSGLRILLSDVEDGSGLVSFTNVVADIGKLPKGYLSSNWTPGTTFDRCAAGAYGYFTTTDVGTVVTHSYKLYNTNPAFRNEPNGFLAVTSSVTSTSANRSAFEVVLPTLDGADSTSNTSRPVSAGQKVTVGGIARVYNVAFTCYTNTTERGTTNIIVDPVLYLTLPQGIGFDESLLRLTLRRYGIRNQLDTGFSQTLAYTVTNVSYLNTTGDGVSIYKISFPKGLMIGQYSEDGFQYVIQYSIPLTTSKNLTTKRYDIADLIKITAASNMTALPYVNNFDNRNVNQVTTDSYGINGGKPLSAINRHREYFSLQQVDEVEVYNAVSVTKVAGKPVPQNWYTYDKSNPNSIALLMGADSGGQLRVTVSNTGAVPARDVSIIVPIAHKDLDLGNVFMDGASEFSIQLSPDEASLVTNDFVATYIKLDKGYDTLNALYNELAGFGAVQPDEANAILLTCANLPGKSDAELLFDVDVTEGEAGDEDIWKNAFFYEDSSSNTTYQKNGDYVAVGVAGSTITGRAFEDTNANGILDSGETGVAGIRITLVDVFGRVESVVTDALGCYEFVTVRDGTVDMTFAVTNTASPLRLNIAGGDVTPSPKGLTATASFTALGSDYIINAPMGTFYTLSYNANGGTAANVPQPVEYGPKTTVVVSKKPDNMTRTGYRFTGWNTQGNGNGDTYLPGENLVITEDTTLYAQWEVGTYYITYDYRGATGGNDVPGKSLAHNTTYGTGGNLPVPTRIGYSFVRWSRNLQGTQAVINTNPFNLGTDITLYAIWSEKSFSVVYDYNDSVTPNDGATIGWTAKVLPVADPTRVGYVFDGWTYNGVRVDSSDTYADLAISELSSITLSAQWTAKTGYTVEYDCNGGSSTVAPTALVAWDEGVVPGVNPTRPDHAFAGWRLGTSAGAAVSSADTYGGLAVSDSNMKIKLVAIWEAASYLVQYNSAGGTPVNDEGLTSSSDMVPAGATPARPGYVFDGWYTASSGGTSVTNNSKTYDNLAGSAPALTLYAHWTPKSYTIQYGGTSGANVGGSAPLDQQTGVKWDDVVNPQNLTKFGYTFDGWLYGATTLTADTATSVESLNPLDNVGNTLTLSALFRENRYNVAFYSQNTLHDTKTGVPFTASYASMLPSQPGRVGYTFQGWRYGGSYTLNDSNTLATLLQDKIQDDTVTTVRLDAVWAPKTGYKIQFNANGGSDVTTRTGISWSGLVLPVESTSRTGYTFRHWSFGGVPVSTTSTYGGLASSDVPVITLYAQWDENSDYTVCYDMNGATSSAISDRTNVRWTETGLLPLTESVRTGYTFTGWNVSKYGSGTNVQGSASYGVLASSDSTSSITLQAQWTPKTGYSVTFNENGATSGTIPPRTGVRWTDDNLLPAQPIRIGYTFAGWDVSSNGSETNVQASATYGDLAANDTNTSITLVARWVEKSNFEVRYDYNDGTPSPTPNRTGVKWTDSGLLPAVNPVRNGYIFLGWNVIQNDNGIDVQSTDTYSVLATNDSNLFITLQAQWKPKTGYRVCYDENGATSGAIVDRTNLSWIDTGLLPPPPTKDDYIFEKWVLQGTSIEVTSATSYGMLASEDTEMQITLVAQWASNTHIVQFVDWDGQVLKTETVSHGENATPPNTPSRSDYTFTGWDSSYTNVNADIVVTAQYSKNTASDSAPDASDPMPGGGEESKPQPSGKTGSPQTGDNSDVILWIVLGVLSFACLCGGRLLRRSRTNKD